MATPVVTSSSTKFSVNPNSNTSFILNTNGKYTNKNIEIQAENFGNEIIVDNSSPTSTTKIKISNGQEYNLAEVSDLPSLTKKTAVSSSYAFIQIGVLSKGNTSNVAIVNSSVLENSSMGLYNISATVSVKSRITTKTYTMFKLTGTAFQSLTPFAVEFVSQSSSNYSFIGYIDSSGTCRPIAPTSSGYIEIGTYYVNKTFRI